MGYKSRSKDQNEFVETGFLGAVIIIMGVVAWKLLPVWLLVAWPALGIGFVMGAWWASRKRVSESPNCAEVDFPEN